MFVASHQLFPLEHPLWLFLTSPGSHSSSFHMFAHSVPHPLPSELTCTSLGHSPHTHAVTSVHIACSHTCHPMSVCSQSPHMEGGLRTGRASLSPSQHCPLLLSTPGTGRCGFSSSDGWPPLCPSPSGWSSGMFASLPTSTGQRMLFHAGNLKPVSMWDTWRVSPWPGSCASF